MGVWCRCGGGQTTDLFVMLCPFVGTKKKRSEELLAELVHRNLNQEK